MTDLLSQIAPQRSTQYSQLARELAVSEFRLSTLRDKLIDCTLVDLTGIAYVKSRFTNDLNTKELEELGRFAMTSAHFESFDALDGMVGPFLRPFATGFRPCFPPEFVSARRYRGKTNELLTQFMCNLARASSGYASVPWTDLRVFDPLAGGGTTLFTALLFGAEAAGVEQDAQAVSTTAGYIRQFCQEQRIRYVEKPERLRKLGKRWTFTLGDNLPRRCILAQGDTAQSVELLAGFKPHLIVTDLPYGIQHKGQIAHLLSTALPVWLSVLPKNGAIVISWDATRFPREEMIDAVDGASNGTVLNDGAYARLAHRVDRVIKRRDILAILNR